MPKRNANAGLRLASALSKRTLIFQDLQAYFAHGGDPNFCEAESSLLYRAAQTGNAAAAHALLEAGAQPSLTRTGPRGSYPLHAAAAAQAVGCINVLMDWHIAADRDFEPSSLINGSGETPLDIAAGHEDALVALTVGLPRAPLDAAPSPSYLSQTLNRTLIRAVAESPLVGDHHAPFDRRATRLSDVVEGLAAEERAFLGEEPRYACWLQVRARHPGPAVAAPGARGWRCHVAAAAMAQRLTAAWQTDSDDALFRETVALYTLETFLHRALNTAGRITDAARGHLAPVLRLLNGALRAFPIAHRHCRRAYRGLSLTPEQRAQYQAHPGHLPRDYLRFDGFLAVNTTAESALGPMVGRRQDALFVVTPADASDPNCCPVSVAEWSAYPWECKALFPLGQQFQVCRSPGLGGGGR